MDSPAKPPLPISSGSGAWIVVAAIAIALLQAVPEIVGLVDAFLHHKIVVNDLATHYAHADMAFNWRISPYYWETIRLYPARSPAFYPIFVYALFWPLTILPMAWALPLFALVEAGVLAVLAWLLLSKIAAHIEGGRWTIAIAALLAGAPVIAFNFFELQVNLHIACLIVLCMLLISRPRNDWLVGLFLGLVLLLKFYFILVLAIPLLRGDWRILLTATAVLALAIAVTALAVPGAIWRDWFEFALHSGYAIKPAGAAIVDWYYNQSLNGYVVRLLGTGSVAQIVAYGVAAAILVVNFAVLIVERGLPRVLYYSKALLTLTLAIYMVAPLTWLHYLIYQIVVVVWLWADLSAGGRITSWRRIGLIALLALLVLPWFMLLQAPFGDYFGWLLLPATAVLWACCLMHRPHGFGELQPAASQPKSA
ncbi:MAG: glycosyltransferase family 87 protein [Rhodospirillales bacterium]